MNDLFSNINLLCAWAVVIFCQMFTPYLQRESTSGVTVLCAFLQNWLITVYKGTTRCLFHSLPSVHTNTFVRIGCDYSDGCSQLDASQNGFTKQCYTFVVWWWQKSRGIHHMLSLPNKQRQGMFLVFISDHLNCTNIPSTWMSWSFRFAAEDDY